jgi:hypothetical protein
MHLFGERHDVNHTCKPCEYPACATMLRLLGDMMAESADTRQRLDIFLESQFDSLDLMKLVRQNKKSWFSIYQHTEKRSHLTKVASAYNYGRPDTYRNEDFMNDNYNEEPAEMDPSLLRVHRIDMRNYRSDKKPKYPLLTNMWNSTIRYDTRRLSDVNRLVDITLKSNNYESDLKQLGSPVTQRNATRVAGKSVSRVRKQLLKLPAALRNALIDAAVNVAKAKMDIKVRSEYGVSIGRPSVSVLLMDVAHVARMLYYAGLGAPQPAKVLVSYDGASHTRNMIQLLDKVIASGALNALKEAPAPGKKNSHTCLTVRFPVHYGFRS